MSNAFVKLLTTNDELGKQFRASFSEALKIINLKTSLLIDEKAKIAAELGKQDQHKADEVEKMSVAETDEIVGSMIDEAVENIGQEDSK